MAEDKYEWRVCPWERNILTLTARLKSFINNMKCNKNGKHNQNLK